MTNQPTLPLDLSKVETVPTDSPTDSAELAASGLGPNAVDAIERSIVTHQLATALSTGVLPTDLSAGGKIVVSITDGAEDESPEYQEAKTAVSALIDTCKNPRNHTPEEWNTAFKNLGLMRSCGTETVFFKAGELDAFEAFIHGLPTEPDLTQPTALAALTAKSGEYAPIDNPIVWQHFGSVLNGLNEADLQLQKDALVGSDGKPSALLTRALHMGQTGALFSYENWEGASKVDLQDTLRALPETAREDLGNRHQLLNAIGRDERALKRDTGFAK